MMANAPGNDAAAPPGLDHGGGNAVVSVGQQQQQQQQHPSSTYQAWSRSFVEMYTITHEWTIDNFIELDEEAVVCFKVLT